MTYEIFVNDVFLNSYIFAAHRQLIASPLQELIEKYGKGELSTEQAANKVGLALPQVPPHPEGWAPTRPEKRLFSETRLITTSRCHDNAKPGGTKCLTRDPFFEVLGDILAGPSLQLDNNLQPHRPLLFYWYVLIVL